MLKRNANSEGFNLNNENLLYMFHWGLNDIVNPLSFIQFYPNYEEGRIK